ncbi:polysaccharide deacetylase family protein [Streptomyces sp. NPDC048664]|uniref:polysaccharide deacetylase family protein n=1 Tax=Streptomyces sp. NPDC048664 TaxID=3154505 RepID=UPI003428BFC5
MGLVRQDDEECATCPAQRAGRARRAARVRCATLVLLAVAASATACSDPQAHDPHARPGAHGPQQPKAPVRDYFATHPRALYARRAAAIRTWGVAEVPLAAPAPPARKPRIVSRKGLGIQGGTDLPPVFTTVPTADKVVFLTVDDGAEKDPDFVRMMDDLKIPYTAFVHDYLNDDDGDGYGYFRRARDLGAALGNATLHDRYLPGLPYDVQREEVCGMQDVMAREFGRRPTVLRPVGGSYDTDTLRAAKSCGVRYVPLWNAEVFADRWEFRQWDGRLHPGDIVLTHLPGTPQARGTMPGVMRRFLEKVTGAGYAVARLEDYL